MGTFVPWESSSSTDSWLSRLLLASWYLAGLGLALASVSDMISVDEVGALCQDDSGLPSLSFGCLRLIPSLSVTCFCFCFVCFWSCCIFFFCLRRQFLFAEVDLDGGKKTSLSGEGESDCS